MTENIEAPDFALREKAVYRFGFIVEDFEDGIDLCQQQQLQIAAIQLG